SAAVWFLFRMRRSAPSATLFPYTTLFRSWAAAFGQLWRRRLAGASARRLRQRTALLDVRQDAVEGARDALEIKCLHQEHGVPLRSEEHTSELQSQSNLVCRLLLEKKKKKE